MFDYYFAAQFSFRQAQALASSALPEAPVQPHHQAERDRRSSQPPAPAGTAGAAPADPLAAAGPNGSREWDPCPCGQWGVARSNRHGCLALVTELFPQLDQELDAWEAKHGWLYR